MLFGRKLKLIRKPNPEAEKKLREDIESEGGLDKKDIPAMLLSAYLVIIPAVLGALLLLLLLGYLLFF